MSHVRFVRKTVDEGRKQSGGILVMISSGSPGVGKSSLALNLGIHLARRGHETILLNGDTTLIRRAMRRRGPRGAADETSVKALDYGLRAVGRTNPPATKAPPTLCQLRAECDVLIADAAGGLSETDAALALLCDRLVLTTTPTDAAIADTYGMLKHLCARGFSGRAGLVVNRVRSEAEGEGVARRLLRVGRDFLGLKGEYLGAVPADPHVARAARQGIPVAVRYPRSSASLGIDGICAHFGTAATRRIPRLSMWNQLAGLIL